MIVQNKQQLVVEVATNLPEGWVKTFGDDLCNRLWAAIERNNLIGKYEILQVKEKFGMLTWYDRNSNDEIKEIITFFHEMSKYTCCVCGALAEWVKSDCWITPIYDKHLKERNYHPNSYKRANDYWDE